MPLLPVNFHQISRDGCGMLLSLPYPTDYLEVLIIVQPLLKQSAKTRPGMDCGSYCELLIAKFRIKLKKVGETTKPFWYDLNQTPNAYTVEVRNRFKGLDLIDRVPEDLRT